MGTLETVGEMEYFDREQLITSKMNSIDGRTLFSSLTPNLFVFMYENAENEEYYVFVFF